MKKPTKSKISRERFHVLANALVRPKSAAQHPENEGRGACVITFDDGVTPTRCHNGMTNDECQALAQKLGGEASQVTPGGVCPDP